MTGWSTLDDLPEAIERPGRRFALGVQWHPEADETSRLIAALVEEARPASRTASRHSPVTSEPRSPDLDEREDDPGDEEMPRMRLTRRNLLLGLVFIVASDGVPLLRPSAARRPRQHVEPPARRRRLVAGRRVHLHRLLVRRLRRALPGRLRAPRLADRPAGELPDHDGVAGGDARVRGGRRRRHRAHGVGAAPVRDARPRGRRLDRRVPRPDLRRLHGRARRLRLRAAVGRAVGHRTRGR